ncbi:IAA-amino acid hydrolase ILR1-like 6 [Orobanche gracilis]
MIEEGVLENVEGIFTMHLLPTGVIGSRSGPLLAGCGFFQAVVTDQHSRGGPILAASATVISLQGSCLVNLILWTLR